MTKLVIIAFVLISLQGLGTYFQMKSYTQALNELRRHGNVAVGLKRSYFKQGKIFILACDDQGVITGAKEMRGITVFERFHEVTDFNGKTIWEFESWANEQNKGKVDENIKKRTAYQQAVLGLLNRFRRNEEPESAE